METPSYEDRVAQALATFLTSRSHTDINALARLLGQDHGYATWRSSNGPETTPAGEMLVRAAWATVLKGYDPSASAATYTEKCMLAGLLLNGRWQVLFQVEKDAYEFVIMLSRYLLKEYARMGPDGSGWVRMGPETRLRDTCNAVRVAVHAKTNTRHWHGKLVRLYYYE